MFDVSGSSLRERDLLRVGVRPARARLRARRRGGDRGEHQQPLVPPLGELASSTSRSSRMRAAETARPVLQASVSGISAVIDPDGTVHDRTELFEKAIVDTHGRRPPPARRSTCASATGWCCWRGCRAGRRRDRRRGAPRRQDPRSVIAATRPTTTIDAAQRTAPGADARRCAPTWRADDRSDRDQHRDLPRHVGGEHEHHRGDTVGDQREHVLHPVQPLQVVGDEDAEQREQDHALRGAEVAAVHAGQEHARPRARAPPCSTLLRRRRRRSGSAVAARSRAGTATRMSTGTTSSNTELGSVSRSDGAGDAAGERARAEHGCPAALPAELPSVADRAAHAAECDADRCCSRWPSPASSRWRAASGT